MIILIVEDEDLLAEILSEELTEAGYIVIGPADTPTQALTEAALTKPDLALVDINLRQGTRGTDLVPTLYRLLGVPSIYLTSAPDEAKKAAFGAIGVISKPYIVKTVLQAVEFAGSMSRGETPTDPPAGLHLFR